MWNPAARTVLRLKAARAAAPYVHARLGTISISEDHGSAPRVEIVQFGDVVDAYPPHMVTAFLSAPGVDGVATAGSGAAC